MSDPNAPEVTVVVVANERFGRTERCLAAIRRHSHVPCKIVWVDGGSPSYVGDRLHDEAARGGLELIRSGTFLRPNAARNRGLARVTTPYVAFLDSDAEVAPGWLSALLSCAKETGAAVVSPVHLAGRLRDGLIRSARRSLRMHRGRDRGELEVGDPDADQGLVARRGALERCAIAFPDSSCMLVRRALLDGIGPLDESLLPGLDGIDLALRAGDAAASIVLEPRALVAHPSLADMVASDVPWFRVRWSDDWLRHSRNHFAEKWRVDRDGAFLAADAARTLRHRRSLPIPAPDGTLPHLGDTLALESIAQTFPQLVAQCRDLLWSPEDMASLEDAYVVAAEMFGDALVDFGRPFLCHSTGTTSIMAAYGARADLAVATLLHSAYSHGFFPRPWRATANLQRRYLVEAIGAKAEGLVTSFVRLGYEPEPFLEDPDRLPVNAALALLISMANAIDGVRDVDQVSRMEPFCRTPHTVANARKVAGLLGVPGLAATFDALDAKGVPEVLLRQVVWAGGHGRLSPVGERILPMANDSAEFPLPSRLLAAGGGKVSVIVADHGHGRHLDRAIESALAQTHTRREVIVVGDGTGDSSAVIARYADRIIRVLEPNGGQGSAWNAGFARSSGDIVVFLEAGDVLYPEACEAIVEAWEPHLGRLEIPLDLIDDESISLRQGAERPGVAPGDAWLLQLGSGDLIGASSAVCVYPRPVLQRLLPLPAARLRVRPADYVRFLSSRFGPVACLPEALVGRRLRDAGAFAADAPGRLAGILDAAIDYLESHPDDRSGEETLILRSHQVSRKLRSAAAGDAPAVFRAVLTALWRTAWARAPGALKRAEIAHYLGLLREGGRRRDTRPDARPRLAELADERLPAPNRRVALGDSLGALGLAGVVPHEAATVRHDDEGVFVRCDPRQWAYSALLPLGLPEHVSGPAVLRLEVMVTAGQLGIGVLDKGSLDRLLGETSAAARARPQELILEIADLARAGTVVLRSWVSPPTRTEAVLLRADLWRPDGFGKRRLAPGTRSSGR